MKPYLLFDEETAKMLEGTGASGSLRSSESLLRSSGSGRDYGVLAGAAGGWGNRTPAMQAVRNAYGLRPSEKTANVPAPGEEGDLSRDLNLSVVFEAMAGKDAFLHEVAQQVVPATVFDENVIRFRQEILTDVLHYPRTIRSLYGLASDAVEESLLYRNQNQPNYAQVVTMGEKVQKALGLMERLLNRTEMLAKLLVSSGGTCRSRGLAAFRARVDTMLSDAFLEHANRHVEELRSLAEGGRLVLGSALGLGLKGSGHVLRGILDPSEFSVFGKLSGMSFSRESKATIRLDNIALSRSADELQDAAFVHVLRVIGRLSDELFRFFEILRFETGFYAGCLNLYETLMSLGVPLCLPEIPTDTRPGMQFEQLVDVGLALSNRQCPVSNSLSAPEGRLFVVTGANQGGKSTYLRSIGLAQLFLQCGLFVTAKQFGAPLRDAVFTHFARPEDTGMEHGRLEEELARMDGIVKRMTGNSMLLLNESFATTTERAGARIALELVPPLQAYGVEILYVTHMYEFANGIRSLEIPGTIFLRAERAPDGQRSFRVEKGEPLPTSYGVDLFEKWVGEPRPAQQGESDG